jgi:Collagen triple helix repeat (20 copies)
LVAASAGVFGVGAANAAGTLSACYQNAAPHAMRYLPSGACAAGYTKISWGAQGAQGAKGAQGAQGAQGAKGAQGAQGAAGAQGAQGAQGSQGGQGPAGAVNATYHYNFSGATVPQSVSTVVASIVPAGLRVIANGYAAGFKYSSGGYLVCRLIDESLRTGSTFSPTPWAYQNTGYTYGTLAETGAFYAPGGASSPIQERCLTNVGGGATVADAAITDVQVATYSAAANGKPSATHRTPANSFVPQKAVPGGAQAVHMQKAESKAKS